MRSGNSNIDITVFRGKSIHDSWMLFFVVCRMSDAWRGALHDRALVKFLAKMPGLVRERERRWFVAVEGCAEPKVGAAPDYEGD
jgi:hypothetical protein